MYSTEIGRNYFFNCKALKISLRHNSTNYKNIRCNIIVCSNINNFFDRRAKHRLSPINGSMIEDEVSHLIDRGTVEWHTHWHGILNPLQYVNCWYPFASEFHSRAAYLCARENILEMYQKENNKEYKKIESMAYKDVISILHSVDGTHKIDFTKHILSATNKDSIYFDNIHWNWAYNFRRIIRNHVCDTYKEIANKQYIPIHELSNSKDVRKWLDEHTGTWILDIVSSIKSKSSEHDEIKAIENVTKIADVICYEYIARKERTKKINKDLIIYMSPSTIRYNYTKTIMKELRKPENNVVRAEVSANSNFYICRSEEDKETEDDIRLSSQVLNYLCTQFIIDTARIKGDYDKNKILTIRRLFPIKTNDFATKPITEETIMRVEKEMECIEVVGVDVLGPEAEFNYPIVCENINIIYKTLVNCVDKYRKESSNHDKRFRKLVFRIHVGESNMHENKYDQIQETKGRDNVYVILNSIKMLVENKKYYKDKVTIRLGHITAITIGQAYFMIQNKIFFEINSISNLRTYAVENEGHLPILKILIADAIYAYNNKNKKDSYVCFTCNSDGNGIMKSSLTDEYKLNLMLAISFVEQKSLANGIRPTVYALPQGSFTGMDDSDVLAGAVYTDEFNLLSKKRSILEFHHFIPEIQEYLKKRATLSFFMNSHPKPSMYSAH